MTSTFDKAIFLRDIDIFSLVNTDELLRIAEISQDVMFKSGQTIFNEGDKGDSLYFIMEGRVEVRKGNVPKATLLNGRSFGIYSILTANPRYFSAIALVDTLAIKIQSTDFMDLLTDNDRICRALIKKLALKVVEKTL